MCIDSNLGITLEMLNYAPEYRVYYNYGYVESLSVDKYDKIDIQTKGMSENGNIPLWTKNEAERVKETILKHYPMAYVEIEKARR